MRYRKPPVVIEALQLTWANWPLMCDFADVGDIDEGKPRGTWLDEDGWPTGEPQIHRDTDTLGMLIPTLEGIMIAREGDYVIRGVKGELYPCKEDIFHETYELVDVPEQGFADPY